MERDQNGTGSSQQPSCSDVGQLARTVRKIMEKEMEPMVIKMVSRVIKPMVTTTLQQEIVPIAEDLIRRVVKEVIQPVEEKLMNGGSGNELPKEGLQLKFLGEVSDAVTGDELKGIGDECLKLVLLDSKGEIVTCGSESSAKVEILLLEDNGDDDMTLENFERSIIQTGEKKKPHFPKSVCISLNEGVLDLNGLKLGHDKDRIKPCNCRLGARIRGNLKGTTVQEAWTAPFKVIDKRDKHYDKHRPPALSSQVWRLDGIGRSGKPCDRLKQKNIKNLRDFLFWLHVNPEELQEQILRVGENTWKMIETHARTCIIDDKRIFSHRSSTEPQTCVVYDVVGNLKGLTNESHFVPIDELSADSDRKGRARELLSSVLEASAFGERYDTSFNDEDSLLKEFPYRSSHTNASSCGLTASEDISRYQTREQGSSSQNTIIPNSSYDSGLGEISNPASGPFLDPQITGGGGGPLTDLDYEILDNVENFILGLDKHSSPTNMLLSEEDKADADHQLLASSSRNWGDMQHSTGLGGGTASGMVGESSSGRSNASFQSARSGMEPWFGDECYCPGPPSPNPMMHYAAADVLSHNARVHRSDTCGDAAAESRVADPPKRWKKLSSLWFALSGWMLSIDASRSRKKRRIGY